MFDSYGQFQASSVAPSGGSPRRDPGVQAVGKAVSLFQSVQFRAQLRHLWGRLTGRPRRLLDLHQVRKSETIESMFERGCVTIEVHKIRGSENRVTDFDDTFLPLKHSARERWAGIYAARICGQSLPAISVVQVGDTYYVRDGHHRVSVARLLGEEYMDAQVQVWQIKGQAAAAPAMSMQMLATF